MLKLCLVSTVGLFSSASAFAAVIGAPSCPQFQASPQLCLNPVPFTFAVESAQDALYLELQPNPFGCSSVGFIAADTNSGMNILRQIPEGPVAPGKLGYIPLPFLSPGTHTVYVMAFGVLGGCNTGSLGSWSADVKVVKAPQ